MKRTRILSLVAAVAALAIAFHSPPASAQDLSGLRPSRLIPLRLEFHNTTAASSVARNAAWNARAGYTDSLVFRHAAAAPTSYDTTISYPLTKFPLPPTFGPAYIPSIADTLFPWFVIRTAQDTVSYGFTGASGMDSVRVWAEFSNDNISWYTASGTPTYRFDVVFATSGADGLQSPTLIGVEQLGGLDEATIPFKCRLNLANGAAATILNQPFIGHWENVRFIFGGDMIGQFKATLFHWAEDLP